MTEELDPLKATVIILVLLLLKLASVLTSMSRDIASAYMNLEKKQKKTKLILISSDVQTGSVSLVGDVKRLPVTILRDTGAKLLLIRGDVLPYSE